jgi:hypothetical protein
LMVGARSHDWQGAHVAFVFHAELEVRRLLEALKSRCVCIAFRWEPVRCPFRAGVIRIGSGGRVSRLQDSPGAAAAFGAAVAAAQALGAD